MQNINKRKFPSLSFHLSLSLDSLFYISLVVSHSDSIPSCMIVCVCMVVCVCVCICVCVCVFVCVCVCVCSHYLSLTDCLCFSVPLSFPLSPLLVSLSLYLFPIFILLPLSLCLPSSSPLSHSFVSRCTLARILQKYFDRV